jgi:hypothetical protein
VPYFATESTEGTEGRDVVGGWLVCHVAGLGQWRGSFFCHREHRGHGGGAFVPHFCHRGHRGHGRGGGDALKCRRFVVGTRFCASAARPNAGNTALERQRLPVLPTVFQCDPAKKSLLERRDVDERMRKPTGHEIGFPSFLLFKMKL